MTYKTLNAGLACLVRPIHIYHGTNGKRKSPSTSLHRILTSDPVSGFADLIELSIIVFFMFHVTESCNFIQRLLSSKDIRAFHNPCCKGEDWPECLLGSLMLISVTVDWITDFAALLQGRRPRCLLKSELLHTSLPSLCHCNVFNHRC